MISSSFYPCSMLCCLQPPYFQTSQSDVLTHCQGNHLFPRHHSDLRYSLSGNRGPRPKFYQTAARLNHTPCPVLVSRRVPHCHLGLSLNPAPTHTGGMICQLACDAWQYVGILVCTSYLLNSICAYVNVDTVQYKNRINFNTPVPFSKWISQPHPLTSSSVFDLNMQANLAFMQVNGDVASIRYPRTGLR